MAHGDASRTAWHFQLSFPHILYKHQLKLFLPSGMPSLEKSLAMNTLDLTGSEQPPVYLSDHFKPFYVVWIFPTSTN